MILLILKRIRNEYIIRRAFNYFGVSYNIKYISLFIKMKINIKELIIKIIITIFIIIIAIWAFNLKLNCFLGHELISDVPAWCWLLK
jgi:hypothetical protein